ncbi:D-alanyl-lipoteichoic acid biosynthesis protein DltD [Rummeliibacillus sp. NPDC094406]|uniref:D-alanyl-lipoteichoic acid biosynthesis protein DltD n=1 Tax=Rummeliibacillus sp. NPDC094406 TaxID=3364511 RepID=UPI0038288CA1
MKKYTFLPLAIAVVLFFAFLFFPNRWLKSWITDQRVEEAKIEMNPLMFQGAYLQSQMLKDKKTLPIYGSSELEHLDPFHPYNYTKAAGTPYSTFMVGRGGTQSITHFLNFAEQEKNLKGKKIIFIISPQWFMPGGIDDFHLSPNYSMLHAYDLAFNHEMDPKIKEKAMRRLLQFDTVKRDHLLVSMYKYELAKDKKPVLGRVSMIFGYLNRALLEKKDLYYSLINETDKNPHAKPSLIKNQTFEQQIHNADAFGEKRVSNNNYNVADKYYNRNIAPKYNELKNSKKDLDFSKSPEYKDFQLMMDVLRDAGAKPLFISIPMKGKWYDYTGYSKEKRQRYYQKIRTVVKDSNFPLIDYSSHEYDPYFITDTLHIGWKGWAYLDRDMDRYWQVK